MSDDDLLLDASDLADIFGAEDEAAGAELTQGLEDLMFGDERKPARAAAPKPAPRALPKPPPVPVHEPEPVEPDRGGMSEEEWRNSSEYGEFKRQVIARHLRQKALQEVQAQEAQAHAIKEAEEAAQRQAVQARAEAEKRKQELLDKYKAAKAATIAQRAQAMVESPPPGAVPAPQATTPAIPAGGGLVLDAAQAKVLAGMFEQTRTELLKHLADSIDKKAAQAIMKKTLAKVGKEYLDVFGRAAVDPKNELRVDGQLDEEKLARAILALPGESRSDRVHRAMHDLLEMRFIAIEVALGNGPKAAILSKTLNILEDSFKGKGVPPELARWYMSEVIPSTSLADSDDSNY